MGLAIVSLMLVVFCVLSIKSYAKKLANSCCVSSAKPVDRDLPRGKYGG